MDICNCDSPTSASAFEPAMLSFPTAWKVKCDCRVQTQLGTPIWEEFIPRNKTLHNHCHPSYLTKPHHQHTPTHSLLSPSFRTKHRTWGNRSFPIAASILLWNSLPRHIRNCTDLSWLKSCSKTHQRGMLDMYDLFSTVFWTFLKGQFSFTRLQEMHQTRVKTFIQSDIVNWSIIII